MELRLGDTAERTVELGTWKAPTKTARQDWGFVGRREGPHFPDSKRGRGMRGLQYYVDPTRRWRVDSEQGASLSSDSLLLDSLLGSLGPRLVDASYARRFTTS